MHGHHSCLLYPVPQQPFTHWPLAPMNDPCPNQELHLRLWNGDFLALSFLLQFSAGILLKRRVPLFPLTLALSLTHTHTRNSWIFLSVSCDVSSKFSSCFTDDNHFSSWCSEASNFAKGSPSSLLLHLSDMTSLLSTSSLLGKDWRQEEKGTTEDKMVGWHHWFNGHEFEQALGVGDGQGSLAWCCPWGRKSWTQLSNRAELASWNNEMS